MAREKRELGLLALDSAIHRAQKAQSRSDEVSFFASVAEAMWWMTMLDEALWSTHNSEDGYESARSSCHEGMQLLGLRYARNRQVHDTEVTGMQGNPLLAGNETNGGEWTWRSLDAPGVPPYTPQGSRWGEIGERAYRDRMATREVVPTLEEAARFLDTWVEELHAEPSPQRDPR